MNVFCVIFVYVIGTVCCCCRAVQKQNQNYSHPFHIYDFFGMNLFDCLLFSTNIHMKSNSNFHHTHTKCLVLANILWMLNLPSFIISKYPIAVKRRRFPILMLYKTIYVSSICDWNLNGIAHDGSYSHLENVCVCECV